MMKLQHKRSGIAILSVVVVLSTLLILGVLFAMTVELDALKKRVFTDNSVKNVKFFPGHSRDATPEDLAREINKYYAEAENGAHELDLEKDLEN